MEVVLEARIPKEAQYLPLTVSGLRLGDEVRWMVDDKPMPATRQAKTMWPVIIGAHVVTVEIRRASGEIIRLPERQFVVR
jgi:hypothetical protein